MKLLLTQILCDICSACIMIILRDGYKWEYSSCSSYFYWRTMTCSTSLHYKGSKYGTQIQFGSIEKLYFKINVGLPRNFLSLTTITANGHDSSLRFPPFFNQLVVKQHGRGCD